MFDEYFVTPEVWSDVFEPRGIACRNVANRRGETLKTVVQLVIEEVVSVQTDRLIPLECETCGRVKYSNDIRGFFPALRTEPRQAIIRTDEYFGSDSVADRWVLISQELSRELLSKGIRGLEYLWAVQA